MLKVKIEHVRRPVKTPVEKISFLFFFPNIVYEEICVFIWFSFSLKLELFWVLSVCAIASKLKKHIRSMVSWINETNGYSTHVHKFIITEGEKKERKKQSISIS